MKLIERLKQLNGTECLILSFPMIECGMTAVVDARINREGLVKLTYTVRLVEFAFFEDLPPDLRYRCRSTWHGMEERAKANEEILNKDTDDQSLFEWTSCVQSQRAEAEKGTK